MANPLLPDRHPERDFFICDFGDVIPKSDIASMEHPLFTLSTKPDKAIREYTHNHNKVTIAPSAYGLATIHDKDILIFCISQLMAGINQGDQPSRTVRFKAHDLLVTTNRQTSGRGYTLLKQAFERLTGTIIHTNIKTDDIEISEGFGIIDRYKIVSESGGRMVELEVTLSEWLFNAVIGHEVLSINRDYFRLRKPVERRIYEIARKHCSTKKRWEIGIKLLHKKAGSSGASKRFRSEILAPIVKHNHLPDYKVTIEGDNAVFSYCGGNSNVEHHDDEKDPYLKTETIEKAKDILGRDYDVYAIEAEWLSWWNSKGRVHLSSPDSAFLGFCRRKI